MNANVIRPLPLGGSLFLFGVPTLLMWVATRWGIPKLREALDGPDIVAWFIAGGLVFFTLFVAAFVGFWMERGRITVEGFAERFRFRRLTATDVLWPLGLLVVCGLFSGGMAGLWQLAVQIWPTWPEPQLSPPFLHVEPLKAGMYWVLLAWLPLFFFNIVGEELWWRGYMLPRQEQKHGPGAWFVHGLGLAVFHLPLGVDLTVILLPFLFALPYVVQRTKNLWTGFLLHGILNGGGFLAVAFGAV